MLGEPTLVAGHDARDAQRVALLPEQRVSAVPGSVRPDLARLRESARCTWSVARPRARPACPGSSGAPKECSAGTKSASSPIASSTVVPIRVMMRIDATTYGLSVISTPNMGLSAVQRPHAERDDVHGPAPHAAPVELGHALLHLAGVHPVVGWPGVGRVDGADERPLLDPGDVGRVGPRPERIRLLSGLSGTSVPAPTSCRSAADHSASEPSHQYDPVGRGELGDLLHPGTQARVTGRHIAEWLPTVGSTSLAGALMRFSSVRLAPNTRTGRFAAADRTIGIALSVNRPATRVIRDDCEHLHKLRSCCRPLCVTAHWARVFRAPSRRQDALVAARRLRLAGKLTGVSWPVTCDQPEIRRRGDVRPGVVARASRPV